MNKKLNPAQILNKAGLKYRNLKVSEGYYSIDEVQPKIQSNQAKAIMYVLCEEINKILEEK